MFDVGFSELILIGLVALLVLGPKRLPETARAAGKMVARVRNFVANVRSDFDTELHSAELAELRKLKEEFAETRQLLQDSSGQIMSEVSWDQDDNTETVPKLASSKGKRNKAKAKAKTKANAKVTKKQTKAKRTTKLKKKPVKKKSSRGQKAR